MINKIRELPEKAAFTIGLSMIFVCPIVLLFIPVDKWMTIAIQGIVGFISILFILSAADKRHARTGSDK
ncbi:hypothetical protein [Rossellomorea aquimaris]|uniref:Uncharacterized protein n=1 Tax=Rossellomorea aquimaris TaxID=189382 RepID=A0A1J6W557_9BACI|nr:hypothetical protein [Rossellomorea aquimaris]OIU71748.1 hypothetical protein BHE18_03565 [Rossellomorea aquimaris]